MNGGYIKLWRSWLEHPIFQSVPTSWGRIALSILLRANWKTSRWNDGTEDVEIPAGSLATSSEKLAALARTTRQQARSALDYLESSGFITSKRTNRYTLINVCNWGVYQCDGNDDNQQDNQQNGKITTKQPAKQPADNQQPKANEDGPSEHVSAPKNRGKQPAKKPQNNHNRRRESSSRREEQAVRLRLDSPVICGETETGKTTSSVEVDDEKKQRPPEATPEAEFRLRIVERHGETVDVERVLLDVKRKLDEGQVDLTEFLDRDLTATTGKLKNPHGHYRALAKRIVNEHKGKVQAFVLGLQMAARAPVESPPAVKLCDLCADGVLPDGGFCLCKVGNLAQQIHERRAEATG